MFVNYKNRSLFILFFLSTQIFAQYKTEDVITTSPLTNIGSNTKDIFSGTNLIYHAAAIGLTYVIIESGLDAKVLKNRANNQTKASDIFSHTGIFTGYLAPLVVPATLYFSSDKNDDLRTASYAVIQSVGLSVAFGTLLKAFTGRKPPKFNAEDKESLSKDFQFGFLKGGIHYGWPSGHLMVNTAMVTTLATFYHEKKWLKFTSIGYVMFMAASIIMHGEAHWFSEVVAGTLFGYVIGKTIGENFRQYRTQPNGATTSFSFFPVIGNDYNGFSFRVKL